jgi:hypothetical protein
MFTRREFLRFAPVAVGGLQVASLSGCAASRPPLPPPAPRPPYPSEIAQPLAEALATPPVSAGKPAGPPRNILVLSGGGQYAAYNTGVLVGWTASGTRPTFDVVTGISSGALVALYAFLGPTYDARLQRFFTTITDKDIYRYRPVVQLIRNSALADPSKMYEIVEAEVNEQFLGDLRAAHAAGRRLYVGTMNVQTRRLCVWDLGAIACCGRPDALALIRKVVVATASIPGLLPAVKFDVEIDGRRYVEEHVDGGAASQMFLRLGPGGRRPAGVKTDWLTGSNLYVMAAGKLYADPLTKKPGVLKRITSTLSASLYALFRAEATNMYAFCGVSGMKFHLTAIGEEENVPLNSFTFNPPDMKRLFARGYAEGLRGGDWRLTPPGAEPGEEEFPRSGEGVTLPVGK